MTQEEIIAGNKLISEFMKVNIDYNSDYSKFTCMCDEIYTCQSCKEEKEAETYGYYHLDWNWLIPTIQKCYECQRFGSNNLIKDIKEALITIKIEDVYKSVISFIKWYNKQLN